MYFKNLLTKVAIGLMLIGATSSCDKGDDDRPVTSLTHATIRLAGKELKEWDVSLRDISKEPSIHISDGYYLNSLQYFLLPKKQLIFTNYDNNGGVLRQEVAKMVNPWAPYDPIDNPFTYETIESKWYWANSKKDQIMVNYIGDGNDVIQVLMSVKRLKKKSAVLYYTIDGLHLIQDLSFEK